MGKHSKCVIDICGNDMQYSELYKKHSNVDGDIMIHKLPKDEAVKFSWINTRLKCRKQQIQEILHIFVTTYLLGPLINPSPVFNKLNPSPVR